MAIEEYRRAAEECFRAEPETASYWRDYADVEPEEEKRRAALSKVVEVLDKWLARNSKDAEALYEHARACALLGDDAGALESLGQAVKYDRALRDDAREDEDFESLTSDRQFLKLVGKSKRK